MLPKTLRVLAHEDKSVPNYERLDLGVNCFLGRSFRETEPGRFGFVPTHEIVEVPTRAEYLKALLDGDLSPADEATAKAAGVKYTPPPAAPVTTPIPDATETATTPSAPTNGGGAESEMLDAAPLDRPLHEDTAALAKSALVELTPEQKTKLAEYGTTIKPTDEPATVDTTAKEGDR